MFGDKMDYRCSDITKISGRINRQRGATDAIKLVAGESGAFTSVPTDIRDFFQQHKKIFLTEGKFLFCRCSYFIPSLRKQMK